jgi:hypothetical protein
MRKLSLSIFVLGLVLAPATPARADVGIGLFLGDPTGLDLKIGVGNGSSLDLLLGVNTFRDGRANYGHVTYLLTPIVAQGETVSVPVRFGIGAALFGNSNNLNFAVRAPVELALRLRRTPLEFYVELALALVLVDPANELRLDGQGGVGFRVFF